jgi:hypothetical protein
MDPKIVADAFGRRIAKRYVAIQVTVANRNARFQFLIHDISLELSSVLSAEALHELEERKKKFRGPEEPEKKPRLEGGYELSSDELSLVRGVAEKGQALDHRNTILRMLRAAGTIAGGITGVTTFGRSYAPSVAAYNGPLLTAFVEAFPDFTINQLIRLNDSAYAANKIVGKQHSLILVAFIPQAQFMSNKWRKKFWKEPISIVKNVDFRSVVVRVDGVFITEVEESQPSVTGPVVGPTK